MFNAGPLNITEAISASNVRAILECYLPAQSGGEAIRRVLYNDGYGANPAGRLPFTWPLSLDDVRICNIHFSISFSFCFY